MKALVLTAYNELEYTDVADPQIGPDDVLIRVAACGICGSDIHGMDGSSGRRVPPVIMGHEAAGVIEDTGVHVHDWHPGDRVTFDSTIYCGDCYFCRHRLVNLCDHRRVLGVSHDEYRQDGAMAEFVAVPSRILYSVPADVSLVDATIVEPLSIAVHAATRAPVGPDTDVAVIGCGVIGLLLVQVLKARGCRKIIAVDVNPSRLSRASGMGATTTLRSDKDDVVSEIVKLTSGRGADVSFEAVGINATVRVAVAVVRKGGAVVLVGNIVESVELPLQKIVTRQLNLHGSAASSGEFPEAIGLIAGGAVAADAIITAAVPLRDGPSWFARLQRGEESLLKVVLEP